MGSLETILQLLFFMSLLSTLGEPIRIALRRVAGLFKSLDLLQIFVLDIYFGGLFLYVLAIIPLQFFSAYILYSITSVLIIVDLLYHWRGIESFVQHARTSRVLSLSIHSYEALFVVSLFVFSLVIQTLSIDSLIFGSTRDTAVHSLFTQVIIENRQIPLTLQPYLAEWIIYPQGFTPVVAYSVYILNYLPPQAIFYLTSVFNSLTILAVYFLGKALSPKNGKIAVSLAFVFTFVASWPKYITWGSNPFVVSFPLFFVCLSFLPLLVKEKVKPESLLGIGIVFGYLAVLHLQTYETLIASLFVLWTYVALKKKKNRWNMLLSFVIISGISLLFLSPFVYRVLAVYANPYHNVGIPNDVRIPVSQKDLFLILTGTVSLFEDLASNILVRTTSLVLFLASLFVVAILRRRSHLVQADEIVLLGTAMLAGQLLILVLGAISPFDLPFYPQPLLLYFPFYFFVVALNFYLYNSFSSFFSQKILLKAREFGFKTRKLLAMAVSLMLILSLYSPFLYQSVFLDAGELRGSYSVFGVTTKDDLQLILWIRENLTREATILVNTYQSGTFIPSIAHKRVVYPSFGSSYSVSYQRLLSLLESNVLNATALNLLRHFNVTDVYTGSGVSSWARWEHRMNPFLFLGNPNFRLVKNFGSACLFEFDYTNASIAFWESFEDKQWNENGWQTYSDGNGLGNVTLANDFGNRSQKCLKITAQAIYTVSTWKYARVVSRQIFVQNNSDVSLSFHFNATQGFNDRDAFAVLVSNTYHNQSMIITTPHGVFENYTNSIQLRGFEGHVEPQNLSAFWHDRFNSSFPATFILEFINYDFDGIMNTAYVDDINVVAMPNHSGSQS